MTRPARLDGPVIRRAGAPDGSTPVARPDAARRGSGAHARVPSRALHAEHGRAAALVPVHGRARRLRTEVAAIARGLEQTRQLARDRGVFSQGWTGLGRRALGGGCPAGRAAGAPAAVAARLGFRGALACVARDGGDGHAPRSPAFFPEGGRAGLSPVAVCGPRARSARGRRARHAECRSASAKGRRWWHSACRVPRLFAPGLRKVAR